MNLALILLQMAMSLLIMAKQTPNISPELLAQINEIANTAIQTATQEINSVQTTTITSPQTYTLTPQGTDTTISTTIAQPIIINQEEVKKTTIPEVPLAATGPTLKPAYLVSSFNIWFDKDNYPLTVSLKKDGELDTSILIGDFDGSDKKKMQEQQNFYNGLHWESYLDGVLINSASGNPQHSFTGTSSGYPEGLTTGTHTWKIILKESGRENTIFEGTFTK